MSIPSETFQILKRKKKKLSNEIISSLRLKEKKNPEEKSQNRMIYTQAHFSHSTHRFFQMISSWPILLRHPPHCLCVLVKCARLSSSGSPFPESVTEIFSVVIKVSTLVHYEVMLLAQIRLILVGITRLFGSWNLVVAFSSLARIWGECSTIHSLPALLFFFLQPHSVTSERVLHDFRPQA